MDEDDRVKGLEYPRLKVTQLPSADRLVLHPAQRLGKQIYRLFQFSAQADSRVSSSVCRGKACGSRCRHVDRHP